MCCSQLFRGVAAKDRMFSGRRRELDIHLSYPRLLMYNECIPTLIYAAFAFRYSVGDLNIIVQLEIWCEGRGDRGG